MTLQQNSTQTSQTFLTEPRFGSTISLEYLEKLITFDIQMIVKFLTNGGIKSLSHFVLQKVQSSDYSNLLKILNLLLKLSNNDPNPLYSSKISLLINEIDKVIHTSDFLTFYPDLQKRLSIDNLIAQLQKKFNELVRKRGFEDSLELQIFEQNFPQKTNTLKKLRVNDKIPQNGKENQISPKILTNKELQEKLLLANQNKGYNKTIGISNENKQIEPERKIRKVRKNVKYKPKNKLVIVEFFENKKEESLDLKLKLQNVLWSQPLSLKTTEGQSLKIKRESKEKMIQEYRQDGCIREIFIFGNKPPFTPEEAKEDSDPNFKFDSSTFFSQFGKNKEKDQIKNNSEFNETKDRDTKEEKVLEQGEIDDDEKEEQQLLNEMKEMNENQVYGENEQNEEKQEEKILIIPWEKNDILSNERLIDSVLENPQLYSTLMNVFSKQENGLQNDPQKTNYIPPIQNNMNMNMNMNMNGNNNFPYSPNNNFQPQPLQYPQQYQQPPQQFQQPPQQFQQQPQQFQQPQQQFQQPQQQFQQPQQQFQQPQQQFQQQPQQYQMQPFNQQNPQSFNQMPPPQMNNMQMQQPPPQQYQQPPPQQQPMYPPQMNNFNGMNNQQNVGYYDQYNTFQNSYPSNNFYPPQNIIQPQYPPPQQY